MSLKRALTALSVAALLALTGCASDAEEADQTDPSISAETGVPEAELDDIPEIVAEVNGEEISRDEFVQTYESQLQQAAMMQHAAGQEVDQGELKQQVAQMLVDNRLLTQAATKAGIEATAEDVDTTLEEVAAQSGMDSSAELIAALTEHGMSEEAIRSEAASQFQVTKFIEQETDAVEPSDDELRTQYDSLVEQQESLGEQGGAFPPFEEVRDQLAEQSLLEQQNAVMQEIIEALHDQADITINL